MLGRLISVCAALEGVAGWQGRIWELTVAVVALAAVIYVVFFYWLPRLRAPRCPECGGYMVEVDRNLLSRPYYDEEGKYHKGREELVYRCESGHELRREREFATSDPTEGRRPEDVFGRETFASWLENEAAVGEHETVLDELAQRLRSAKDEAEDGDREPDKNEPPDE